MAIDEKKHTAKEMFEELGWEQVTNEESYIVYQRGRRMISFSYERRRNNQINPYDEEGDYISPISDEEYEYYEEGESEDYEEFDRMYPNYDDISVTLKNAEIT